MRLNWTTVASTTAAALLLFWAGCQATPVADGFHTALPPPRTVVAVWGNHPTVTAAATTWLLQQGLVVLEQNQIQQVLAMEANPQAPIVKEVAVLNAAKSSGAKMLVFITHSGDVRAPMVSVRGIEVDNSQIMWSGHARYPDYVKRPFSDLLAGLTCQALATAWGKTCSEKDKSCC